MSLDDHKILMHRYVDELNRRNLAILDKLVAEDVCIRSLNRTEQGEEDTIRGRVAYREGIVRRITALPDYHVTILEMIAEGDQVMLYWRNRGTHTGTYLGLLPTGKLLEEVAITIYRIANGQIVEVRGLNDNYDLWHQLGLLPDLVTP